MIHPQYWSLQSAYERIRHLEPMGKFYGTLEVKDKVVLDVGAGRGVDGADSVRYFLKREAKRIICIEKDAKLAGQIDTRDSRVFVIPQAFNLEHLSIYHDCMKMNIEGYEALLFDYWDKLKPSVVMAHNWYIVQRLEAMGFRRIGTSDWVLGMSTMVNYP